MRPAGELAAHAGVSAQTASNHLAKLVAGGILRVEQRGRWRYYRLAGEEVGHAVEALAVVAPRRPDGPESNGAESAGDPGETRPVPASLQRPDLERSAVVTLCIRYTLDAGKRADFERYARTWPKIIRRCGGDFVGYYLPTKLAGPTNVGMALINFPDLAAYEQYRRNLMSDPEAVDNVRRADESRCILVEDRAFVEHVGG